MARAPQAAAKRFNLGQDMRPVRTAEQIQERESQRRQVALSGAPMQMVIDAVIDAGGNVEIDTETHTVSIVVTPK